jgi:hypothetical protein
MAPSSRLGMATAISHLASPVFRCSHPRARSSVGPNVPARRIAPPRVCRAFCGSAVTPEYPAPCRP